jgi:hypothetical protein
MADDFEHARQQYGNDVTAIKDYLNNLQSQRQLGCEVSRDYVNTALRFRNITAEDWVLVYFQNHLGLARVCDALTSSTVSALNVCDEVFKFRQIGDKKLFNLGELPDAYRLIPSQVRGNVHEYDAMWRHVQLLADTDTPEQLWRTLRSKTFAELLEFFGALAWESFCFAYLILEEDFVPTGLSIGRTLPAVDIVGRRQRDGVRIIAQCKKSDQPDVIEDTFLGACGANDVAYYFAYGGCIDILPNNINIIDRNRAMQWVEKSAKGKRYKELLLAE